MKKPTKQELDEVMGGLIKFCSLEEIAVVLDKTQNTIWSWKAGRRLPSASDFYVMKRLLEDRMGGTSER